MENRALWYLLTLLFYLGIPALSLFLLSLCSRRPWTGILPILFILIFAGSFLQGAQEYITLEGGQRFLPSHTLWIAGIKTFGAIICVLGVLAYVSFLMYRIYPQSYTTETSGKYLNFVSTYVWHFFEVTRLIQVGTTFGLENPDIRPRSWYGGIPLLVFKLFAIGITLVFLAKIWSLAMVRYEEWLLF